MENLNRKCRKSVSKNHVCLKKCSKNEVLKVARIFIYFENQNPFLLDYKLKMDIFIENWVFNKRIKNGDKNVKWYFSFFAIVLNYSFWLEKETFFIEKMVRQKYSDQL